MSSYLVEPLLPPVWHTLCQCCFKAEHHITSPAGFIITDIPTCKCEIFDDHLRRMFYCDLHKVKKTVVSISQEVALEIAKACAYCGGEEVV